MDQADQTWERWEEEEVSKTLYTLLLGDDKWPGDPHPPYHSML